MTLSLVQIAGQTDMPAARVAPTKQNGSATRSVSLWKLVKAMALGSLAGGAVVVGAPVVLYAAGFSSIGPVAGSLAAKWMAGAAISGRVKSGSAYAILQSVAMSGALVSAKSVLVGSAAGCGVAAASAIRKVSSVTW